ncbi:MAG: head-tail adaptor protein [Prolixibacteraceae bacterium]
MLSGNLKYKAQLFKRTGEDNNIEYEYYKTINAQLIYKNGASVVQSYQLLNTKSLTIKIRNRKDIDSTMRIKIKDEFFDIIHLQFIGSNGGDLIIDLALTL